MDHDVVVLQKVTERYLLNELASETRNEFEEHFFGCPECAIDVRAGAAFLDQSKVILAEAQQGQKISASSTVSVPRYRGWQLWLRPALTAPVMALLLAVVGYQNLVTYPKLKQASAPQVMEWASVNIGTYGGGEPDSAIGPQITTPTGKGFLLFVRIPHQAGYSRYTAELYNPAGTVEMAVPIPADTSQDRWPIAIPGANRPAGTYSVVVRGTTPTGETVKVGQGSFELHIQN